MRAAAWRQDSEAIVTAIPNAVVVHELEAEREDKVFEAVLGSLMFTLEVVCLREDNGSGCMLEVGVEFFAVSMRNELIKREGFWVDDLVI